MAGLDERALLARANQGDVDAFAELVREYEHRVRVVLHRLLDDPRDVEEATQDTFVQAWRSIGRFRGEAALFTWLYRIAVNEALGRLRRKRLRTTELDDAQDRHQVPAGPDDEPHAAAEADELGDFLAEQIRRLEPEYRAPLVLRDVIGLSNDEVAEILDLSVPATKSRVHRARMQIREALERWEEAASG